MKFDSAELDGNTRELLRNHAEWLQNNSKTSVTIEGHCDARGTNEYNLALGERRARAVYDFLKNSGVSSSRLRTISYGEELLLETGMGESAHARNRRAHFSLN